MQGKINMDLSFCQAENGYSLDELMQKPVICEVAADDFTDDAGDVYMGCYQSKTKRKKDIGNVVITSGNHQCFSQGSVPQEGRYFELRL